MNEQRIQAIKDQIRSLVQTMIDNGWDASPEIVGLMSQVIQKSQMQINDLRAQEAQQQQPAVAPPVPPTPNVPPLDAGPYPSSNVNSFKYDPRNGTLFVKFHGKDSADSGPVYQYQNVPRNIYDVFSRGGVAPRTSGQNRYHRWIKGVTPSLGASLYALIREGGYPYQRVG